MHYRTFFPKVNLRCRYIDYLLTSEPHVYSNKFEGRTNTRKYIGVVFTINNYNYFIPLSSPKDKDYEIIGEEKRIRKDTYLIFRIKSVSKGKAELKGTIQFSKMIPVPNRELIEYNVDAETDINYKNLVLTEIQYIRKNSEKIVKRAQLIYNKRYISDEQIYNKCLDFKHLEALHDEWLDFVSD